MKSTEMCQIPNIIPHLINPYECIPIPLPNKPQKAKEINLPK